MGSKLIPLASIFLAGSAPQQAEFEQLLARNDSATAALGEWCAAHHSADAPVVTAQPVKGEDSALPSDARALLEVSDHETLGYRHVRLTCDGVTLSEAHNWFVPARLTDAMNATLASTDTPFGKVVAPLHFTRERLEARHGRLEGCPPGTFLTHRALLRLPDGKPISLVVECYQREALEP
ncbi:hypothetical protein EDF56_103163 [Novosphingobium sp. PhB165]|uniref:hypothetical protein n=1 Tax=Novosphingobium sp. PhB165 TaxID=2485105 RepID=UPI0010462103|nr:hypothetical protein [Novosphingobium sp. PhB165]TCM19521.1 hypothetical protein EDF56_103163 [Novosphingobium sp. PhB165]